MDKWARIKYQPAVPLGTDGKAVTSSQFEDMVNEANDPDTSEERKAELLKV